jgi:hypothetical protein
MWPLLLLIAEPVWVSPSSPNPPVISACIPANEYVRGMVYTATATERQSVFAERLLLDGSEAEDKVEKLEGENKELRETNGNLIVWVVALGAVAVFVGTGGVVLW